MMELLNALLFLFLVIFFVTRDEGSIVTGPRAVDDNDTWP